MCQIPNSVRLHSVRLLKKNGRSRTEWTVTRPYSYSSGVQLGECRSCTELYGVVREIESTIGAQK